MDLKLLDTLANASPAFLFLFFIFALYKGWIVLGRELTKSEKEREEYKQLVLHTVRLGESAASLAETLKNGR